MLAYSFQQFHDFFARHSSFGEAVLMLLSFVPALLETKKLWNEIKEEKGFRKTKHWTALIFCWLLPVIVSLSTRATDWSSEDALHDVRIQSSNDLASAHTEIGDLSNQVQQVASKYNEATNALARAIKATKPKSLKEQLTDCLDSMDPGIIMSLTGHRSSECHVRMFESQYEQLQILAAQAEASEYISNITSSSGLMGTGGSIVVGDFEIFHSLLQ